MDRNESVFLPCLLRFFFFGGVLATGSPLTHFHPGLVPRPFFLPTAHFSILLLYWQNILPPRRLFTGIRLFFSYIISGSNCKETEYLRAGTSKKCNFNNLPTTRATA